MSAPADLPYLYVPALRPCSTVTLPPGITWDYVEQPWGISVNRPELPLSRYRYGTVALSRRLTSDEESRFEMLFLSTRS